MVSPTEIIPLLIVVLLLLSASGAEPDTMDVVLDGDHAVTAVDDVLVVGGGTATVPENASVAGRLFAIGGDLQIEGQVDGNVRLLAGNLTVGSGAEITGELQTIAGEPSVAEGARIGSRSSIDVTPRTSTPAERAGSLALQVVALALAGGWFARRRATLLRNVGDSITHHTVVSGVVGSIAGAALLVLFVYMAFTLILLPLSVVGLLAGFLVIVYAYVTYGFLIGRRLPIERVDVATAVGVGAFVIAIELLGRIPVLGAATQFMLVAVGLGAVLITYFGLQRFEPAAMPGGER